MKITRSKLRQIIKEELAESDRGDRHWASNPNNPLSSEDDLGVTEPKHTVDRHPATRLVHALMQRSVVDGMSAEEAATKLGFGDDQEVIVYIQSLLDNRFLDNPGRVGSRSPVGFAD
jgi:hypothetical protein